MNQKTAKKIRRVVMAKAMQIGKPAFEYKVLGSGAIIHPMKCAYRRAKKRHDRGLDTPPPAGA